MTSLRLLSLLFTILLITQCVHSAPSKKAKDAVKAEKESVKEPEGAEDHPVGDLFPEVQGLVGPMVENVGGWIPRLMQEGQVRLLSLSEDLLEKSTEMVDHFGEITSQFRNSSKFRTETKQKLRYLKKKARHLREDLEDQIEVEKEKAKKAEDEESKREALESVSKLKAAKKRIQTVLRKKTPKKRESDSPSRRERLRTFLRRLRHRHDEQPEESPNPPKEKPEESSEEPKVHTKEKPEEPEHKPEDMVEAQESQQLPKLELPPKKPEQPKIDQKSVMIDKEPKTATYTEKPVIQKLGLGDGFGEHTQ